MASQQEVYLCYDMNVKCPRQAHIFNIWSPADGTVWEDCGIFRRWSPPEGSGPLGVRFYSLLASYSLSASCGCNVPSSHLLQSPQFPPNGMYFLEVCVRIKPFFS